MDSNGSGYDISGHHSDLDPIITEIKGMTFPGITSPDVRSDLKALLLEYSGLFRGVGLIADEEFKINLKPDTDIMRLSQKRRRKSPREEMIEQEQFKKHMKAGIIEESESPIGVNNVFVPKKTLDTQGRP